MESLLTTSNIVFAIGIIGTIFGIYRMFHDPQVALDKQQDLDKQEADNQLKILGFQAESDRKETDRRFTEVLERVDKAFSFAQNHTHTVDVKVETLTGVVNQMNLQLTTEITKLGTIIQERFPRKD